MPQAAPSLEIGGTLWDLILQSVTDPISIITADHVVVWANVPDDSAFVRSRGRPEGLLCHQAFMDRDKPCPDCPLRPVFQTGRPHVASKFIPQDNGGGQWNEVHAYPIADRRGRVSHVVKIGFNVTERLAEQQRGLRHLENLERGVRELLAEAEATVDASEDLGLSTRERQVLPLVAQGLTNKQIASVLAISHHTVKTHVINIFNKLGVNDRAQAAAVAARAGLA